LKQIIANCDIILAILWDLEVIEMNDTSIASVLNHNKRHAIKVMKFWFMPANAILVNYIQFIF
jgi:hypothetical protein